MDNRLVQAARTAKRTSGYQLCPSFRNRYRDITATVREQMDSSPVQTLKTENKYLFFLNPVQATKQLLYNKRIKVRNPFRFAQNLALTMR